MKRKLVHANGAIVLAMTMLICAAAFGQGTGTVTIYGAVTEDPGMLDIVPPPIDSVLVVAYPNDSLIYLLPGASAPIVDPSIIAYTDKTGNYVVEGARAGQECIVTAGKQGYLSQQKLFTPNNTRMYRPLDFLLAKQGDPSGNPVTLTGSVALMKHPQSKAPEIPLPDVTIKAFVAPQCDQWPIPYAAMASETLSTKTDISGQFQIELPASGIQYQIEAYDVGSHPQTIFLVADANNNTLRFELIEEQQKAIADVEMVVTNRGAPVESAFVSIVGGREPVMCIMPMGASAAPIMAPGYYGYTAGDGRLLLKDVSLSPYIDYSYNVSRAIGNRTLFRSGMIRLNVYWLNQLSVDLDMAGITIQPVADGKRAPAFLQGLLAEREWSQANQVYLVDGYGRMVVRDLRKKNSVAGLQNGVYYAVARSGTIRRTAKLVLLR